MKLWITKYALTRGIEEDELSEICANTDVIRINGKDEWLFGGEWHTSRQSAIAHAEKMRRDKLRSLRNQIEKLEALKFT